VDETTSVADSAPATTPSEPSAPSAQPPSQPADSSVDSGTSKEGLLDAVLKVVPATNETDVLADRPKDQADAPDAAPQPDSEDQAETETEDGPDEEDETPPAEASPALRKKINKLLKQRRELRGQVAQLEGPAQIGSELDTFAKSNDLSGDDITNTLRMAAMLRAGDYASFYKAVAPFVRTAQEYLGIVLPRDLGDRVKQGHMTQAAAQEFARQRYDHQRSEYERQNVETASSRQAVQHVQNDVRRAISSFELRLSANDPDYKAKAPAVRRAAQAMLFERGGTIATVDEALEITKAAYDEVNKQVRAYQPRPHATAPKPNGASQSPSARPAPKSIMEAALQGLENARRAGG
jgi:hypothetical protein